MPSYGPWVDTGFGVAGKEFNFSITFPNAYGIPPFEEPVAQACQLVCGGVLSVAYWRTTGWPPWWPPSGGEDPPFQLEYSWTCYISGVAVSGTYTILCNVWSPASRVYTTVTVTGKIVSNDLKLQRRMVYGDEVTHSRHLSYEDRLFLPEGSDVSVFATVSGAYSGDGSFNNSGNTLGDVTWPDTRALTAYHKLDISYVNADVDYEAIRCATNVESIYSDWSSVEDEGFYLEGTNAYSERALTQGTGTELVTTVHDGGDAPGTYQGGAGAVVAPMRNQLASNDYKADFSKLRVVMGEAYQAYPEEEDNLGDALIWGGFRKVPYMSLTWPQKEDTEIGGTGSFDDGDPVPVRLSELVGITSLPAQLWRYKYNTSEWEAFDTPFWLPPFSFRVDRKWLRDNQLWSGVETWDEEQVPGSPTWEDNCLIINVATVDKAQFDAETSPFSYIEVSHVEADVDLSGSIGTRVTPWQAEAGVTIPDGGQHGSDPVPFTIQANQTAPSIYRNLLSNFPAKLAWVISTQDPTELPQIYWLLRSNSDTGEYTGDPAHGAWPDEDVWNWTQHNYAKVVLDVPAGLTSGTVTLRVTSKTVTVVDDYMTGSERAAGLGVTWSGLRTTSWSQEIHGDGEQSFYFCLSKNEVGAWYPNLQVVEKIELEFPATGAEAQEWELRELKLVHDGGDDNHEAPSAHCALKFAEDWRAKVSGGFSGNVDGAFEYACATWDRFRTFEAERVLPCIKWVLSRNFVLEMNTAYALRTASPSALNPDYLYLLSWLGEGWRASISSGSWEAALSDGENFISESGYACWIFDALNINIPPSGGFFPWALRGLSWYTSPSVGCAPWACLKLGGGIQGLYKSAQDFYRSEENAVEVQRREGSGGEWEAAGSADTNEHGWFGAGFYEEAYDYEADGEGGWDPRYYNYQLVEGITEEELPWGIPEVVFTRLYRRQWASQYLKLVTLAGCLYIDPLNTQCYIHFEDGELRLFLSKGEGLFWPAVTVASGISSISDLGMFWQGGNLFLRWTENGERKTAWTYDYRNFSLGSQTMELSRIRVWGHYGHEFVLGYSGGSWYCRRLDIRTGSFVPFSDGSTFALVAEGPDVEAGFWGNSAGHLYVGLPVESGWDRYVSYNHGENWRKLN